MEYIGLNSIHISGLFIYLFKKIIIQGSHN